MSLCYRYLVLVLIWKGTQCHCTSGLLGRTLCFPLPHTHMWDPDPSSRPNSSCRSLVPISKTLITPSLAPARRCSYLLLPRLSVKGTRHHVHRSWVSCFSALCLGIRTVSPVRLGCLPGPGLSSSLADSPPSRQRTLSRIFVQLCLSSEPLSEGHAVCEWLAFCVCSSSPSSELLTHPAQKSLRPGSLPWPP